MVALSRNFGANALGQGKKKGGDKTHSEFRGAFLDRLRFLFPLAPEEEELWVDFRAWFPNWIGVEKDASVGAWLLQQGESLRTSKAQSPVGSWMRAQLVNRTALPKEAHHLRL